MDLELSADAELFARSTHDFLAAKASIKRTRELVGASSLDREVWASGAQLGWFSPLVDEKFGGGSVGGRPVSELAIVAEELGGVVFPGPAIPTNVVAYAIGRAGSIDQKSALLAGLVSGELVAAAAVGTGSDPAANGVAALRRADELELNGTVALVQDAHLADLVLVTAITAHGPVQVVIPLDRAGIGVELLDSLDLARTQCNLNFRGVRVRRDEMLADTSDVNADLARCFNLWLGLQCAETVGVMDRAFTLTVEYARMRNSFGRSIGSFQAIKHSLADMLRWLETAKALSVHASEALDSDHGVVEATSSAKSYLCEFATALVRRCIQIHGGIGVTWEHDLHLYVRRVESNALLLGGAIEHLDRVAREIIQEGANGVNA